MQRSGIRGFAPSIPDYAAKRLHPGYLAGVWEPAQREFVGRNQVAQRPFPATRADPKRVFLPVAKVQLVAGNVRKRAYSGLSLASAGLT